MQTYQENTKYNRITKQDRIDAENYKKQAATPTTFTQIVTRLTAAGFITETADGKIQNHVVSVKTGRHLTYYLATIGFSFIDTDYRGITQDMWSSYGNAKAMCGIKTNGKTWSWDTTLARIMTDLKRDMAGQIEADYKRSNINWDA